ncbi:hypothetical protein D3C84_988530 [compost metagenome]
MAGRIRAEVGELGLQVLHLVHDQAGVLEQFMPGRRQFHAAAVAVQQAGVELAFQRLDAGAGGGRREKGPASALGQARGLTDMNEKTQVSQVEMHGRIRTLQDAFSIHERRYMKMQILRMPSGSHDLSITTNAEAAWL